MINKHDAGLGKSILHQILEHTFQIGILPHLLFSGTREQPVQHFIKIQLQKLVCVCVGPQFRLQMSRTNSYLGLVRELLRVVVFSKNFHKTWFNLQLLIHRWNNPDDKTFRSRNLTCKEQLEVNFWRKGHYTRSPTCWVYRGKKILKLYIHKGNKYTK